MPTPDEQQQTPPTDGGQTSQEIPPEATPPAKPPASQQAAPPSASKKMITVPSDRIGEIRREENERGKKAAEREQLKRAKALGYDSIDAMFAALERKGRREVRDQGKQQQAKPQQPPATPPAGNGGNVERKFAQAEAKVRDLTSKLSKAERSVRLQKRELERLEAESQLRESAVRAGVQDIDYAMHLLRREMKDRNVEGEFDETAWFEGLKKKAPHVFAISHEPASTAPPPESKQSPKPAGGGAAPPTPSGNGKDARQLSAQEYKKRLAELGVTDPSSGALS